MPGIKTNLFSSILLGLLSSVVNFAVFIATNLLISNVDNNHQNRPVIAISCVFILALTAIIWSYISKKSFYLLNRRVMTTHMPNLWQHILSLPLSFFYRYSSIDLAKMVLDYESSLSTLLSTFLAFISHCLLFTMLASYLLYCQFQLGLIAICSYLFLLGLKIAIYPYQTKLISSQLTYQSKHLSFLQEALAQIQKIRTANIEEFTYKKWRHLFLFANQLSIKISAIDLACWLSEAACPIIILVSFYSSIYLNDAPLDTFRLLSFMLCMTQLTYQYEQLSREMHNLLNSLSALKRIEPLINEPIEVQPLYSTPLFNGKITLATVSFRQLNNISLEIAPCSFTALVGPSGTGKSSILRLILGLEDNYKGDILFDGINIKHLNRQEARKQFGVVLQTSSLMTGTIFSNIVTNTSLTLGDAWELVNHVGLADEINAMPMKMFTYISDTAGDSISGGQKQKILLARALATQPNILLLDEATSALDNISQKKIFNYLASLNITRLIIAHRHSTIMNADKIYYVDQGQVLDSGTYNDLLLRKRIAAA